MRIIPLWLLVILNSAILTSQSNIQAVKYICETNIVKGDLHDGVNTLYFSATKSLYVHDDWPKESQSERNGNVFHFELGDSEGMPVYRNTTSGEMIWKSDYSASKTPYIFTDTLPIIKWNITNQSKSIARFSCIKVRGEFGNRMYTVWFTPEIPAPFGPYKIGGLPGLILQAYSDDGRVSYEFHSFIPDPEGVNEIKPPKIGKKVTNEEFKKQQIRSLIKVEAKYKGTTHNDPDINWEIEKDKWKIYSTYKKNRKHK